MTQLLKRRLVLGPFLLATGLVGCSGSDEPPARGSDAASDEPAGPEDAGEPGDSGGAASSGSGGRRGSRDKTPPATPLDPRPYSSSELGALHGTILFEGDAPERFPLGARHKSECTHHPDVEHLSDIEIVNDGKVQFAFVQIRSGFDEDSIPAAPSEPVRVDQRGCIYTPHVSAMQAGQTLEVSNSDPTTHNVNINAPRNGETGNVNMGQGQAPLTYPLARRETVNLKCDIHPWMSSVVHVAEHPWFAVTAADGSFEIPDVPPGDYVVEAVHERFGKVRGTVSVTAGVSSGFSLTLSD